MLRHAIVAAALCCSAGALEAQRTGTLIVTNKAASTASLISLSSGRVVAELPTGNGPHEVAASSDGRVAVVTDYGAQVGGSSLTVIDVPGKRVARTVDLGSYTRPHGVAFMPGDSVVAVTSEASRNVVLVRVRDGSILGVIPTGQGGSHMLAIPASGERIFTGNIADASVSELNVATRETVRMFAVPSQPEAISVTPDGEEVWVGSNNTGVVSVVHTRDGRVETVFSGLGRPYRVLITPDRQKLLIPDLTAENLRVYDYASRSERGRVSFAGGAPQGIMVAPDSRTAWVSMSAQDRLAIVDLESLAITGYLPAGNAPDGIAYSRVELQP